VAQLGVDTRVTLNWILTNWSTTIWIGFIWLFWTCSFYKIWETSTVRANYCRLKNPLPGFIYLFVICVTTL